MANSSKEKVEAARAALDAIANDEGLSRVTVRDELQELAEYLDCLIEKACDQCPEGT